MLEHFKRCVLEKKEASIVYLGGSITEGQGVDDKRLCWQGLLQTFLEQEWSGCFFRGFNAGIGGTDSRFGAYRMERDVLPHRPDLLLVEFAVNDYSKDAQEIRDAMEAILCKLWRQYPMADVLFVLTATIKMSEADYAGNKLPESVRIHMEVAGKYGIPCVNVGERLLLALKERKVSPQVLLPDLVHPGREGYRVYFQHLKEFFQSVLKEEPAGADQCPLSRRQAVKGMQSNPYISCGMIPASHAKMSGFVHEHIAMCGRYGSYVSSHTPGDWLEFSFRGSRIGLFYTIAGDSGDLEWSLDGGKWQHLSCWDNYALHFDRGSACMLSQGLNAGEHILRIRVKGTRAEESKGSFIRISDFLV